jgi:hypothetical protein
MVASYPSMNVAAGEDRFPPRTFQIRELQAVLIKPAGPIVNMEQISWHVSPQACCAYQSV